MTARILIKGQAYPIDELFARPTIADLIALKLETDIGLPELRNRLVRIDALPGGVSSQELFDHPDLLEALLAVAWLAKRQAGERVTYGELRDTIGMGDLQITGDAPADADTGAEPEDDEAADPTPAATGSTGPDAAPAASRPSSPKTRRRTSASKS